MGELFNLTVTKAPDLHAKSYSFVYLKPPKKSSSVGRNFINKTEPLKQMILVEVIQTIFLFRTKNNCSKIKDCNSASSYIVLCQFEVCLLWIYLLHQWIWNIQHNKNMLHGHHSLSTTASKCTLLQRTATSQPWCITNAQAKTLIFHKKKTQQRFRENE